MPRTRCARIAATVLCSLLACAAVCVAQNAPLKYEPVDPTKGAKNYQFEVNLRKGLKERWLWVKSGAPAGSEADRAATRYFRRTFTVDAVPIAATLYIAGPAKIRAWLNGQPLVDWNEDPKTKIHPFVVVVDVASKLKTGHNVLAIEAAKFPRDGMETFGAVLPTLAVKIVPAAEGVFAQPIVWSDQEWNASLAAPAGWEQPKFDDSKWALAEYLSVIDDGIEHLQWNWDANMYRWPGYDGITVWALARMPLRATQVMRTSEGAGHFGSLDALTNSAAKNEFTVTLPSAESPADSPSLMLDFGREVVGRVEFVSDSAEPARVETQYGESAEEAVNSPYLGATQILVPAHETAYGPKSAFRYVQIKFLQGPAPLKFKSIRVDDIFDPVKYTGSFESSDPMLNRIWEVGAYTAHLCMQDGIWDAPKRDRAWWMGDLDVSGRVIDTVFADEYMMKRTMDLLIGLAGNPVTRHVNTIPGYSAFWVMGEADYYRHHGDKIYLSKIRPEIVNLLAYMSGELDEREIFVNKTKAWPFVDWSPGFSEDTPEARAGTDFEFYRAFVDGAWMLREAGDATNAAKYEALAEKMKTVAQANLLDAQTKTFGSRWQENAAASFSGIATSEQSEAAFEQVFSKPPGQIISPYYNFYAIEAMANSGHRKEALDWIKKYWGGMIDEGATSFWEAYDPSWPKENFHSHLQADGTTGYYVSLAHGWSSGPTAWLTEEILGIQPTSPGFATVKIRPDLAGLGSARGTEPTPHGTIRVDYSALGGFSGTITLPKGVAASAWIPTAAATVIVNGKTTAGTRQENSTRLAVKLVGPGRFVIKTN
jgi:alpha-L-rhamnosidase